MRESIAPVAPVAPVDSAVAYHGGSFNWQSKGNSRGSYPRDMGSTPVSAIVKPRNYTNTMGGGGRRGSFG